MSRGGRDFATRKVVLSAEVEPDQTGIVGGLPQLLSRVYSPMASKLAPTRGFAGGRVGHV